MRGCQNVHHPLSINLTVFFTDKIAEATAGVIVDSHKHHSIKLCVFGCVREIFVIVHMELLV